MLAEFLRPQFLPENRPTSFNYPGAITGKWHGDKYRFLQRFRSDDLDALDPEFDAPFARLEYVGRDCFDVSWHRHTGEWFCLYRSVSLTEWTCGTLVESVQMAMRRAFRTEPG